MSAPGGLLDQAPVCAGLRDGAVGGFQALRRWQFFWDREPRATLCRHEPSFHVGEDRKLAERPNWEKQGYCLELCFIPLEMTVLYFYVNNSQQRGVCEGAGSGTHKRSRDTMLCFHVNSRTVACGRSKTSVSPRGKLPVNSELLYLNTLTCPSKPDLKNHILHEDFGITPARRPPCQLCASTI